MHGRCKTSAVRASYDSLNTEKLWWLNLAPKCTTESLVDLIIWKAPENPERPSPMRLEVVSCSLNAVFSDSAMATQLLSRVPALELEVPSLGRQSSVPTVPLSRPALVRGTSDRFSSDTLAKERSELVDGDAQVTELAPGMWRISFLPDVRQLITLALDEARFSLQLRVVDVGHPQDKDPIDVNVVFEPKASSNPCLTTGFLCVHRDQTTTGLKPSSMDDSATYETFVRSITHIVANGNDNDDHMLLATWLHGLFAALRSVPYLAMTSVAVEDTHELMYRTVEVHTQLDDLCATLSQDIQLAGGPKLFLSWVLCGQLILVYQLNNTLNSFVVSNSFLACVRPTLTTQLTQQLTHYCNKEFSESLGKQQCLRLAQGLLLFVVTRDCNIRKLSGTVAMTTDQASVTKLCTTPLIEYNSLECIVYLSMLSLHPTSSNRLNQLVAIMKSSSSFQQKQSVPSPKSIKDWLNLISNEKIRYGHMMQLHSYCQSYLAEVRNVTTFYFEATSLLQRFVSDQRNHVDKLVLQHESNVLVQMFAAQVESLITKFKHHVGTKQAELLQQVQQLTETNDKEMNFLFRQLGNITTVYSPIYEIVSYFGFFNIFRRYSPNLALNEYFDNSAQVSSTDPYQLVLNTQNKESVAHKTVSVMSTTQLNPGLYLRVENPSSMFQLNLYSDNILGDPRHVGVPNILVTDSLTGSVLCVNSAKNPYEVYFEEVNAATSSVSSESNVKNKRYKSPRAVHVNLNNNVCICDGTMLHVITHTSTASEYDERDPERKVLTYDKLPVMTSVDSFQDGTFVVSTHNALYLVFVRETKLQVVLLAGDPTVSLKLVKNGTATSEARFAQITCCRVSRDQRKVYILEAKKKHIRVFEFASGVNPSQYAVSEKLPLSENKAGTVSILCRLDSVPRELQMHPVDESFWFVDGSDKISVISSLFDTPKVTTYKVECRYRRTGEREYHRITMLSNYMLALLDPNAKVIDFLATCRSFELYQSHADEIFTESIGMFDSVQDQARLAVTTVERIAKSYTKSITYLSSVDRAIRGTNFAASVPRVCDELRNIGKLLLQVDQNTPELIKRENSASQASFRKLFRVVVESSPYLSLLDPILATVEPLRGTDKELVSDCKTIVSNYIKDYNWPAARELMQCDLEFINKSINCGKEISIFGEEFWDGLQLSVIFLNESFNESWNMMVLSLVSNVVVPKVSAREAPKVSPREGTFRTGIAKWIERQQESVPSIVNARSKSQRMMAQITWLIESMTTALSEFGVLHEPPCSSTQLHETLIWLTKVTVWRVAQGGQGASGARSYLRIARKVFDTFELVGSTSLPHCFIRDALTEVCFMLGNGVLSLSNVLECGAEAVEGTLLSLATQDRLSIVSTSSTDHHEQWEDVLVSQPQLPVSGADESSTTLQITASGYLDPLTSGTYCLVARPHPYLNSTLFAVSGIPSITFSSKLNDKAITHHDNHEIVALLDIDGTQELHFAYTLCLQAQQKVTVSYEQARMRLVDLQLVGPIANNQRNGVIAMKPKVLLSSFQKLPDDTFWWNSTCLPSIHHNLLYNSIPITNGQVAVLNISLRSALKQIEDTVLESRVRAEEQRMTKLNALQVKHPERTYDMSPKTYETSFFGDNLESLYSTVMISSKSKLPWLRFLFVIRRICASYGLTSTSGISKLQEVLGDVFKTVDATQQANSILHRAVHDVWLMTSRGQELLVSPECSMGLLLSCSQEIDRAQFCAKHVVPSFEFSKTELLQRRESFEMIQAQFETVEETLSRVLYPLNSFTEVLSHVTKVKSKQSSLTMSQAKQFLDLVFELCEQKFDLLVSMSTSSVFATLVLEVHEDSETDEDMTTSGSSSSSSSNSSDVDEDASQQDGSQSSTVDLVDEEPFDESSDLKNISGTELLVSSIPGSSSLRLLFRNSLKSLDTVISNLCDETISFERLVQLGFSQCMLSKLKFELNQLGQYYVMSGNLNSNEVETWVSEHVDRLVKWSHCNMILRNSSTVLENFRNAISCLDPSRNLNDDTSWSKVSASFEQLNDFEANEDLTLSSFYESLLLKDLNKLKFCESINKVFVELSSSVFKQLPKCDQLIKYLRRTPSDTEFSSSLEIAFSKSEMDAPTEMWNRERGCIDEAKLGAVSTVRSMLYPIIFAESFPLQTIHGLESALSETCRLIGFQQDDNEITQPKLVPVDLSRQSSNIPKNALEENKVVDRIDVSQVVHDIETCVHLLHPIMTLFADASAANVSNRLMVLLSRNATWLCRSPSSLSAGNTFDPKSMVELTYKLEVDSSDGEQNNIRTINIDQLVDFQASLILAADELTGDVVYLKELIESYCTELNWMTSVAEQCAELWSTGHIGFRDYQLQFPFLAKHSQFPTEQTELGSTTREASVSTTTKQIVSSTSNDSDDSLLAVEGGAIRACAKHLSCVLEEWKLSLQVIREEFIAFNYWTIYQLGWLWEWMEVTKVDTSSTDNSKNELMAFLSTWLHPLDPTLFIDLFETILREHVKSIDSYEHNSRASSFVKLAENQQCVANLSILGNALEEFLSKVPAPKAKLFNEGKDAVKFNLEESVLGSTRQIDYLNPGFHFMGVKTQRELWEYTTSVFLSANYLPGRTNVLVCSSLTTTQEVDMFFGRWELYSRTSCSFERNNEQNESFHQVFVLIGAFSMSFDVQQFASSKLYLAVDQFEREPREEQAKYAPLILVGQVSNVGHSVHAAGKKRSRNVAVSGWSSSLLQRLGCTLFPPAPQVLQTQVSKLVGANSLGVEVFISSRAGQGKSFTIRQKAKELGVSLSYFRINQCTSKKSFIQQLRKCLDASAFVKEAGSAAAAQVDPTMSAQAGSCTSPVQTSSTLLHIDISDCALRNIETLKPVLYEFLYFGGVRDSLSEASFYLQHQNVFVAIELPSSHNTNKLLREELCYLTYFPQTNVKCTSETFAISEDELRVGFPMGYGRGLRSKDIDESSLPHHKVIYVCQALNILNHGRGCFPHQYDPSSKTVLSDSTLEIPELPSSEECFNLLLDASNMSLQSVSMWCMWNFINTLFQQLQMLHSVGCPVNDICAPDPDSGKTSDVSLKESMKAEFVGFVIKTAREIGVRSTRPIRTKHLTTVWMNGFSVNQGFNKTWIRASYDVGGKPSFQAGDNFLYFRPSSNTWVIDDVVVPTGAVFSETKSSELTDSTMWYTSPDWSTAPNVRVVKSSHPLGYKKQSVTITGCRNVGGSLTDHENGEYLMQPPFDNINGQPHYILRKDGENRRHLFYSCASGCWKVAPVCTEDEGAFMISSSDDLQGYWKSIGTDVKDAVKCQFHYANEDVQQNATETEKQNDDTSTLADDYLPEDLLSWNESNHESFLFSNENHVLAFLSLKPSKLKSTMHPALLQYLEENHINVGEDYSKSDNKSRMYNVLGALTNKTHPLENALSLLDGKFSLTKDGLLKMLAVYMRLRCNIPVLLLGECGCGKTMLIRYLAAWLEAKLVIRDIHGGTTEEQILETFQEAKEHVKNVLDSGGSSREAQVLVFLDEVNTCGHLGIISEAFFERSINGQVLPDEILLLGALNPYRFVPIHEDSDSQGLVAQRTQGGGASGNVDPMANLVYRVHPIPYKFHDVVFDFGSLAASEENMYISAMIKATLGQRLPPMQKLAMQNVETCIRFSQWFVRDVEKDRAAVSLRDVQRCLDLVCFFVDFIEKIARTKAKNAAQQKKTLRTKKTTSKEGGGRFSTEQRCVVLGVLFVYYFRLPGEYHRSQYLKSMRNEFPTNSNFRGEGVLKSVLDGAQHSFCSKVQVDEGIAMNNALAENIFVTIVSVLNKIPVFLCGKPGTSKTLAIQVMASNLRGDQSPRKFWRSFPSVHLFQYQCSPMSSADAIQHQFNVACRYQEHSKEQITVLLLDEVGLAEQSPDFPLKVLHAMLVKPPISIVGLSNWVLDRAKMNRAILLQRTEPSESEILLTGRRILSTDTSVGNTASWLARPNTTSSNWLTSVANAYFTVHQDQLLSKDREFFGMRDYYSLIKSLRLQLKKTNAEKPEPQVLTQAVCRNFGGKTNSIAGILTTFHSSLMDVRVNIVSDQVWFPDSCHPIPRPLELIQSNLDDPLSRNLMILCRNGVGLPMLLDGGVIRLDQEKQDGIPSAKDATVLVGSQFPDDTASELFLVEQINAVKRAMANGQTIVLVNHGNIYEALYDVLNQRYVSITNSETGRVTKMLRLAIGNKSQLCDVREGFKVVLIVEEHEAYHNLDLPLLNRFEKQQLRAQDVLQSRRRMFAATQDVKNELKRLNDAYYDEIEIVNQVQSWALEISSSELNNSSCEHVFCGFQDSTVATLVLSLRKLSVEELLLDIGVKQSKLKLYMDEIYDSTTNMSWAQSLVFKAACAILARTSQAIASMMSPTLRQLTKERNTETVEYGANVQDVLEHMISRHRPLSVVLTSSSLSRIPDAARCNFHVRTKNNQEGVVVIEPSVLDLATVSSEKQLKALIDAFLCPDTHKTQTRALFVTCDPIATPQAMIDHARLICAHRMEVAKAKRQETSICLSLIVFVVHVPPSLKNRTREYSVDYYQPWTVWSVDDVQLPVLGSTGSDVVNATTVLVSNSPLELVCGRKDPNNHLIDLEDVVRRRFHSALTICRAPANVIASLNDVQRRGESYWSLCNANEYPFLGVMLDCIIHVLEKYDEENPKSGQFLHVDMTLDGSVSCGSMRESLVAAVEQLVIRAFAKTLVYIDTNSNCQIAMHPEYSETWGLLSASPTILDPKMVAANIHLQQNDECFIGNTGEVPFISRFPWSWRIIEVLDSNAVKQHAMELVNQSSLESVSLRTTCDRATSFLVGVLCSRVGDVACAKVQSHGVRGAEDYIHDVISTAGIRRSKVLSHEHQYRLTIAILKRSMMWCKSEFSPATVHLHLWLNELRLNSMLSLISAIPHSNVEAAVRSLELEVDELDSNSGYVVEYDWFMDQFSLALCDFTAELLFDYLMLIPPTGVGAMAKCRKASTIMQSLTKVLVCLGAKSLEDSCNNIGSSAFVVFKKTSNANIGIQFLQLYYSATRTCDEVITTETLIEPLLSNWVPVEDTYVAREVERQSLLDDTNRRKKLHSLPWYQVESSFDVQNTCVPLSNTQIRALLMRFQVVEKARKNSLTEDFLAIVVEEALLNEVFSPWKPLRWKYRAMLMQEEQQEVNVLHELLRVAQAVTSSDGTQLHAWGFKCDQFNMLPGTVLAKLTDIFCDKWLLACCDQGVKVEQEITVVDGQRNDMHPVAVVWFSTFNSYERFQYSSLSLLEDVIAPPDQDDCASRLVKVNGLFEQLVEVIDQRVQLRRFADTLVKEFLIRIADKGDTPITVSSPQEIVSKQVLGELHQSHAIGVKMQAFVSTYMAKSYGMGMLYRMLMVKLENHPRHANLVETWLQWLPLSNDAQLKSKKLAEARESNKSDAKPFESHRKPVLPIVVTCGSFEIKTIESVMSQLVESQVDVVKAANQMLSLVVRGNHHHVTKGSKGPITVNESLKIEMCFACDDSNHKQSRQVAPSKLEYVSKLSAMVFGTCFMDLKTEQTMNPLDVGSIAFVENCLTSLPSIITGVDAWDQGTSLFRNEVVEVKHIEVAAELLNGGFETSLKKSISNVPLVSDSMLRGMSLVVINALLHCSKSWLMDLVLFPLEMSTMFIPFMSRSAASQMRRAMGYVGWYKCPNGHLYTVGECTMPMEVTHCPSCGAPIGGQDHVPVAGVEKIDDEMVDATLAGSSEAGYIHGDLSSLTSCGLSDHIASLGKFMLHVMLLWSSFCPRWYNVREFMLSNAKAGLPIPDLDSAEKLQAFLWTILLDSWKALKSVMPQVGEEDVEVLLSVMLRNIFPLVGKVELNHLSDGTTRVELERKCSTLVGMVMRHPSTVLQECESLKGTSMELELQFCLPPQVGHSVLDTSVNDNDVWHFRVQTSLADFKSYMGTLSHSEQDLHGFLNEFLMLEESLSQIKYIGDILAWHKVLFRAFDGIKLTRESSREITNRQVVERLPEDLQENGMQVLDAYCVAFNNAFPCVDFLYECQANPFLAGPEHARVVDLGGSQDGSNAEMSRDTPIAFSLPCAVQGEVDAPGLCTVQLLQVLQEKHNRLVTQLRENPVGLDRRDRVQRDRRGRVVNRVARFDVARGEVGDRVELGVAPAAAHVQQQQNNSISVPILTVTTSRAELDSRLIMYSRAETLIPVLFASSTVNQITGERTFQLEQIGRALKRALVTGKQEIRVVTRNFSYAGDVKLQGDLARLVSHLPQERLPTNLTDAICREIDTVARVRPVLDVIEDAVSLLSHLKLVAGEEDRLLSSFVLDGLQVDSEYWEKVTTPTITSWVRLKHLQHLFMALEEMLSGNPLENVLAKYRDRLEDNIAQELASGGELAQTLMPCTALLRDLMVNQLCGESSSANWPVDASLCEYLGYSTEMDIEETVWFGELEKLGLELRHTYELFQLLQ